MTRNGKRKNLGSGPHVWIGDTVYDEVANKKAIVTDFSRGTFVLRPLYGTGTWPAVDPEKLVLVKQHSCRDA